MKRFRIRTFIALCFTVLTLPLLFLVTALLGYTLHHNEKESARQLSSLVSSVTTSMEEQLDIAQSALHDASLSMEFLHFGYARQNNRLNAYTSALNQELNSLLAGVFHLSWDSLL